MQTFTTRKTLRLGFDNELITIAAEFEPFALQKKKTPEFLFVQTNAVLAAQAAFLRSDYTIEIVLSALHHLSRTPKIMTPDLNGFYYVHYLTVLEQQRQHFVSALKTYESAAAFKETSFETNEFYHLCCAHLAGLQHRLLHHQHQLLMACLDFYEQEKRLPQGFIIYLSEFCREAQKPYAEACFNTAAQQLFIRFYQLHLHETQVLKQQTQQAEQTITGLNEVLQQAHQKNHSDLQEIRTLTVENHQLRETLSAAQANNPYALAEVQEETEVLTLQRTQLLREKAALVEDLEALKVDYALLEKQSASFKARSEQRYTDLRLELQERDSALTKMKKEREKVWGLFQRQPDALASHASTADDEIDVTRLQQENKQLKGQCAYYKMRLSHVKDKLETMLLTQATCDTTTLPPTRTLT